MRKAFLKFNFLLITTVLLLLLGRQDLLAQPAFSWANSITEVGPFFGSSEGFGVIEDNNGDVITTGSFMGNYDFNPDTAVFILNSASSNDAYVQKVDGTDGSLLWAHHFGNGLSVQGNSVTVDNNNDVYVIGQFQGTIVFGGNVPDLISNLASVDIFVVKLDGNTGAVLWARNYGLPGADSGKSITFNQNTNEIIFTGSRAQGGNLDIYVHSIDLVGADNWVRTFGGSSNDRGNSVTTDNLGNVYVTGVYVNELFGKNPVTGVNLSSVLLNAPTTNLINTCVLKLDSGGNFNWAKSFNTLQTGIVFGHSIAVDKARNTYITGYFSGGVDLDPGVLNTNTTGSNDAFIVSLDITGAFRWLYVFNANGAIDEAYTIAIDQQGDVVVGGEFRSATNPALSGLFISKHFAGTGAQDWIHTGGEGMVYSLVTGQCDKIHATGAFNYLVVDLDPDPGETFNPFHAGQSYNAFTLAWGNSAPDITLNDEIICDGENPLLTVNTNGGQFNNFNWIIEDDNGYQTTYQTTQGNLVPPQFFTADAPYSVSVEATTSNGCIAETTAQIFVNPNPIVALTPSTTTIVCGSGNNNITVDGNITNPTTSPYTYNWTWSGNTFNQTSPSTSNILNTTISNTTIFNLNVSDDNGCSTEANSTITVLQAAPVTIFGDLNVCQGESPTYTVTNIPGATYLWSNGATTPSTTINNIQTDWFLSVAVTDMNGCTSIDQITITVNSPLTIGINPPNTACSGDNLDFSVFVFTSPNPLSYQWSNNNSTTPFATYSNVSTGPLTVSVIVTDVVTGCSSTDQFVINVNQCCFAKNNSDYLQIGPNTDANDLAQFGIIRSNANFYQIVDGNHHIFPSRVYVDEDVTLQVENSSTLDITNCDMVFGEGAGIVVTNNCRIIANNAVLRPCHDTKTWDGIRLFTLEGASVDADFHECTFINATVALWFNTGNPSGSSIADNSFKNCQHGIVVTTDVLVEGITSNIFRIDDAVSELYYTALTDINNTTLGIFQRGNLAGVNNFQSINNLYNTFYSGIELIGSSDGTIINEEIISKNEFVNVLSFKDKGERQFTGIISSFRNGLNISDNSFTNLNRSIISHINRDITIENNFIEITRRSTTDESSYQIIAQGDESQNNITPKVLIHNNTLVNSADPENVTPFTTTKSELIEASGAIYLERFWTSAQVTENSIQGFEVGIYTHKSRSRITRNTIKSHICGIYMSNPFTDMTNDLTQSSFNTVACNHIDMYRDMTSNHITEGWPIGLFVLNPPTLQIEKGRSGGFIIHGNCISNTRNAIWFENTSSTAARFEQLYNNYLYNYEQSGLRFDGNFGTSSLFIPSGGNSAFPFPSGRNSFIGNGDPSISTFSDISINSTNPVLQTIDFDFNDFGVNNVAKLSLNNVQPGSTPKTRRQAFTVCANNDVQDVAQEEFDRMAVCDDANVLNFLPVLQRKLPNGDIALANDYLSQLEQLFKEYGNEVATLVKESLLGLTDEADVITLYQAASQLNLQGNATYWIDFTYQKRTQDYLAAAATLDMIDTEQGSETTERVIVESIQMNLLIHNTSLVSDPADIEALKTVGDGYSGYMNTARELLDRSIGGYSFKYRPVILPLSKINGSSPTDFTDNGSFIIYPNPTNSQLFVDLEVAQFAQWSDIKIYDLHGRVLRQQSVNANKMAFDVSEFPTGTYVISLIDAEGKVLTEKFVKQ